MSNRSKQFLSRFSFLSGALLALCSLWGTGCSDFKSHHSKDPLPKISSTVPSWEPASLDWAQFQATDCRANGVCWQRKVFSELLAIYPIDSKHFWVQEQYRIWRVADGQAFTYKTNDSQFSMWAASAEEAWFISGLNLYHLTPSVLDAFPIASTEGSYEGALCGTSPTDVWATGSAGSAFAVAHFSGDTGAVLLGKNQIPVIRSWPGISIFCFDPNHVWWSSRDALFRYNNGWVDAAKRHLIRAVGRSSSPVWAIELNDEDEDAPLSLVLYDGEKFTAQDFPPNRGSFGRYFPPSLWMDEQERLWIGTDNGVFRKTSDGWETIFRNETVGLSPDARSVWKIAGTSSKDVWFYSFLGVVLRKQEP